jgi:hypothetical protein
LKLYLVGKNFLDGRWKPQNSLENFHVFFSSFYKRLMAKKKGYRIKFFLFFSFYVDQREMLIYTMNDLLYSNVTTIFSKRKYKNLVESRRHLLEKIPCIIWIERIILFLFYDVNVSILHQNWNDSFEPVYIFYMEIERFYSLFKSLQMLDFFYILTNGGLVLWCMPSTATKFLEIINNAIDHAILQVWLNFFSVH